MPPQRPPQRLVQDQDGGGTAGRWFKLHAPLGDDVLIVTEMAGEEGISRLFRFGLTVVSLKKSIAPTDILGQAVTLEIGCYHAGDASAPEPRRPDDRERPQERERRPETDGSGGGGGKPARYLNGIVTRLRPGRFLQNDLREYRLEVAPKLWLLQHTSRYRVFQDKTVIDILKAKFDEHGVTAYKDNTKRTFGTRDYCVQYGETDFAFVTRLMAEEGIFYYFEHKSGEHKLVLEDDKTWSSGDAKLSVPYNPGDKSFYDVINVFAFGTDLIDHEFLATDYDYQAPGSPLTSTTSASSGSAPNTKGHHHVHAAGVSSKNGDGFKLDVENVAKFDAGHAEAGLRTGGGEGAVPHFVPGLVFKLSGLGKPVQDTGQDRQRRRDEEEEREPEGGSGGGGADTKYVVTEVVHDGIEPSRYTQPRDAAPRAPYRNTFACVPAEVALPRAVPPQKPLARGPMTALVVGPSGSEIHTDKYGRIKVQFYWDQDGAKDEKSSCFIRVAQPWSGKNWGAVFIPRVGMEVVVQFIDGDPDRPLVTGTVYNGTNLPPWTLPDKMTKSGFLTRSTKGGEVADANELSFDDDKGKELFLIHAQRDLTREVENDEKITVDHDQITEVKNDRTTTVKEGNDTLTVKTGNQTHEISQGNRAHTVKTGNDTLDVNTGNRTVTIKTGNHDLKVNTGNASTTCSVGKITLTATQAVKLVCGGSSVELTPTGITLKAPTITIQADAMLDEKAPMINIKADGIASLGGSLVKIN